MLLGHFCVGFLSVLRNDGQGLEFVSICIDLQVRK